MPKRLTKSNEATSLRQHVQQRGISEVATAIHSLLRDQRIRHEAAIRRGDPVAATIAEREIVAFGDMLTEAEEIANELAVCAA